MRKTGSTIFEVRWILALVIALIVTLSWSAAAHAQTPADDEYGSPLSSAGSQGVDDASAGTSGSGADPEGYGAGEDVAGSGGSGEDPAVGVLPDTGGASLLLGSAIALMLVGTGMLAIRGVHRR